MRSDAFALVLLVALPGAAAEQAIIGPGVGNADTLVSEGTKLYNQKKYPAAIASFTKATRANPTLLPPYLQLARSLLSAKQVQRACYVYRMYLKAAPETADRKKAQAESEQCERQLKTAKNQPADLSQKYVETKANFFAALDRGALLEKDGAYDSLKSLVTDGFMGPELADMAGKFGAAASAAAEDIHKRAMAYEKLPVEVLKTERPLYQAATETGTVAPDAAASSAFCDGLAALQNKEAKKAEALFAEAAKAKPENHEYTFYRAVALVQAGDKKAALRVLETDLKDDPRTETLRTSMALGESPDQGATELERMLFSRRYPADK
jgi:thioredoxin-like negative regulator of GroEL